MRVELISYQQDALDILLYTKNTRLQGEVTLNDIKAWPMDKKLKHLDYMRNTIKSSWEFANYIFEIKDVTRAFTHQLVRTRDASYAQQSQRTVDVRVSDWETPTLEDETLERAFDVSVGRVLEFYAYLIDNGSSVQNARGILPTNMHTSIIMGCNLRTLHHMAEVRLCTKTQGEYQDVFREIKSRVVEVHPWADDFIQVFCVNHGTCCFPNYTSCPIQKQTLNGSLPKSLENAKVNCKREWENTRHEAVPVASGGMAKDVG